MGKKLAVEKSDGYVYSYCEHYRRSWYSLATSSAQSEPKVQRIIKTVGFKITAKPGFGWLCRFQGLGKKLLGE